MKNKNPLIDVIDAVESSICNILEKCTNGLPDQIETTVSFEGKSRKLVILVLEVDSE